MQCVDNIVITTKRWESKNSNVEKRVQWLIPSLVMAIALENVKLCCTYFSYIQSHSDVGVYTEKRVKVCYILVQSTLILELEETPKNKN